MSSYADRLASLYKRTQAGIKLGLHNTEMLLAAVGHPERCFESINVAGTNGKGSTSALLADYLQRRGCRTGLFTSPHLLQFSERIKVDGVEITQGEVMDLYAEITRVEHVCDYPPTFFEIVTVMAAMLFREKKVDVAVFEVGLGGRLDATNVMPKNLAIITPIALDHQHLLGDTISAIAAEKGGIIPAHGTLVTSTQSKSAEAVLQAICRERQARCLHAPTLSYHDRGMLISGGDYVGETWLQTPRPAAYQAENIATAALASQQMTAQGVAFLDTVFADSVAHFQWPGRFQLIDGMPPILLDGAHNPAAMEAFLQALKSHPTLRSKPRHVVFSALRTKASQPMFDRLSQQAASIHLCPTALARSLSHDELVTLGDGYPVIADPREALRAAVARASKDNGVVVVTGSLFLVADALAWITGDKRDPPIAS